MPSASTITRRQLKDQDPERYEEILIKQRARDNKRNAERRLKWESEPHTRAQIEEREAVLNERRRVERERYAKKKAFLTRQTRSSPSDQIAEKKRPRDMTPDEFRQYNAEMRRKQRQNLSHQKKTAIRLQQVERRRKERLAKRGEESIGTTPQPAGPSSSTTPGPSSTSTEKMRQSLYNLNHNYRQTAKKLGASNEEYARSTLNLVNPRTPAKRAAIREHQRQHPCKALFTGGEEEDEPHANLEEELAIQVEDILDYGPPQEEIIPKPLHNDVKLFYQRDDVSRMLPHARYTTKHGPARIMLLTVKDTFLMFGRENAAAKIGLSLFQSLRPKNVRLMGSVPLESCLCIYCTNVRLKLTAVNKLLVGSGQIPPEKDMLTFLTCPYEGRWPRMECVDGICTMCANRMRSFQLFCRDIIGTTGLTWERWERNPEGKMEPIRKDGNLRDLLHDLEKDINEPTRGCSFLQHLFTAYWQYSQFKYARTNPDEGEVVMVQDFGENRKAAYSSEIKSAHFGKHQITVHPVVCFFRSGDTVVRESLIFLSDDTGHDHHAVREFTRRTLEHLTSRVTIKKIVIWSDGAASQYKGRGTFHDLTLLPYSPQRCYYGSEHGKGEADGETGIMSQALRRATFQGQNFSNAKEMVDFLSEHYATSHRHYILVDKIDRVEPDDEVLTIPGTRKYHQFETIRPYVLRARRLACFCTACREGRPQSCINIDVVGEYAVHKCKPSVDPVLNQAFMEPPSQELDSSPEDKSSDEVCPKVGDYVKLTCQINKAQKIFYAVVISLTNEMEPISFMVRFLQKSGKHYSFSDRDDEGLIAHGPPDHFSWRVLSPDQWTMDHRSHYSFNV